MTGGMDHTVDHPDELAGRRLRIGIRLVLYPLAVLLIVVAWHRHTAGSGHINVVSWKGVTSQGETIRAVTVAGALTTLETRVFERCFDGSGFTLHWRLGSTRFVQHGKNVSGGEGGPGHSFSGEPVLYDDRMWGYLGAHPGGTISAQAEWTKRLVKVHCQSGPIAFSLRRL
jgi:hypothetical protein